VRGSDADGNPTSCPPLLPILVTPISEWSVVVLVVFDAQGILITLSAGDRRPDDSGRRPLPLPKTPSVLVSGVPGKGVPAVARPKHQPVAASTAG
jgi:hypothetical protein